MRFPLRIAPELPKGFEWCGHSLGYYWRLFTRPHETVATVYVVGRPPKPVSRKERHKMMITQRRKDES